MMNAKERKQLVEVFSALASQPRLKILEMLAEGQVECQEILGQLDLSQPAISYHLGKLERAGVLLKEKDGPRNCYRLSRRIRSLIKMLTQEDDR